jgi:hypothetical protein
MRRIVISALLAVAAFGFFYAFTRPTDQQQPAVKDVAVKHVEPAPGDRVLRQTEVVVDLDPTYTGVLSIDGHRLPEDQLSRISGLNRVAFAPGDGKDIVRFAAGRHKATVEFWLTAVPNSTHRYFSWNFEVH